VTTTPTEEDFAIAEVRGYCGWHIAPEVTEDVTLDGTLSTVLRLPTLKLVELNSLSICEHVIDVTEHSEVEWSAGGWLRRAAGFGGQLRGVVANITHGFETMPLDVPAVIDGIADRSGWITDQYVQVGQVRVATGGDGAPIGGELSSSDIAVLDRYKLPPYP
jgi:hypothetical protein